MNLNNTKMMLNQMLEEKVFDTYALLVHYGNEETMLFSENADEYTYFDLASMGKVLITSTLILQAISRGKLNFEDTLDMFWDVEDDEKKKITVKQLLTHTSGIQRKPITEEAAANGHDAIAELMISYPLSFAPGTEARYSCNGYILLGFMLEKIYGASLEDVYRENIAVPLGLERTAFEIALDEPNAALCHRWKEMPKQRFDSDRVLIMGTPAGSGGQHSCLNDIHKTVRAFYEKNELLYPKEYFDMAERNYTPDFSESRGLGYLFVDENYPQTGKLFPTGSFGHTGSTGQSFFINREKQMYVIFLTNSSRYSFIKSDFMHANYHETMKMREDIHNAILRDICNMPEVP